MNKKYPALVIIICIFFIAACFADVALFHKKGSNHIEADGINIESLSDIDSLKNYCSTDIFTPGSIPSGVPVKGNITSGFGWRQSPFGHGRDFHKGVDFKASIGSPIISTANGEVQYAGLIDNSIDLGLCVSIKHKYGHLTIYGQMSKTTVVSGQKVNKGDTIGFVGKNAIIERIIKHNTDQMNEMGRTVAEPHCHYEIRITDIPVNPESFIDFDKNKKYPCTPAHYAASIGRIDLIKRIYEKKPEAVLDSKDALGFYPVDLADIMGMIDIVSFIKNAGSEQ